MRDEDLTTKAQVDGDVVGKVIKFEYEPTQMAQ